jgi:chemotaxis response regulator CheB
MRERGRERDAMRIGIVNGQPEVAEALRRAIALASGHEVAWVVSDGRAALESCRRDKPELVLMDIFVPGMDGVEATRRIMAATPCAIVVVASGIQTRSARVFEAMGHGALDAVEAPMLDGAREANGTRAAFAPLLAKIDMVARLLGRQRTGPATRSGPGQGSALVAIGASAGGPAALAQLLAALPADFTVPVVVVQHVEAKFALGMARWLDRQTRLAVRTAAEPDTPCSGEVLLAATSDHLVFKSAGRLGYTADPVESVYRPSVDVFFDSICRHWRGDAVGVLLTGMGRDGALGLKALRNHGWHTIAQDQPSSAVYGMPKAAAQVDAAVEVLPLTQIVPKLLAMFPPERK